MAIIKEKYLIEILLKSKNVLLIEPPYIRQYVPLGLAKIASFIKKMVGMLLIQDILLMENGIINLNLLMRIGINGITRDNK